MAPLPTNAYSLAVVVRSSKTENLNQSEHQKKQQQYVLVHERFPRGWWLPGGGIEHKDSTPVDAAVRETIEEAALPQCGNLPVMTHLLALEQTPGRIRFIFRGEWCDDDVHSILKCPPGDNESIEAKWITFSEIKNFNRRRKHIPREQWLDDGNSHPLSSSTSVTHPWLRGHEPSTFFGMLEKSLKQRNIVPGLKVQKGDTEVGGAFFSGPKESFNNDALSKRLTIRGRAAFLIHLKCRLIVYASESQQFCTMSRFVDGQNGKTLRQLSDEMLSQFSSLSTKTGLQRVDYTAHENGREATLTVFPYAIISSNHEFYNDFKWVSKEELPDTLDQRLAAEIGQGNVVDLNILRDSESEL
eukprot:scaffold1665_cov149-Skeletonema_menzelii.AAC.6